MELYAIGKKPKDFVKLAPECTRICDDEENSFDHADYFTSSNVKLNYPPIASDLISPATLPKTKSASKHHSPDSRSVQHWGSSLSMNSDSKLSDLTSRKLAPADLSTTQRQRSLSSVRSAKPTLPDLQVKELQSPCLADYLEKPRFVSVETKQDPPPNWQKAKSGNESQGFPSWRNLRLGNFMEENKNDEIIPELLRKYYIDTFFGICETCGSHTHCDHSNVDFNKTVR